MKIEWIFGGLLCLLTITSQGEAGSIFKFEDNEGTVHFSDEIPETNYKIHVISFHETLRKAIKRTSKADLKKMITKLSEEFRMEPHLVQAVVKAESEYDPMAVSRSGARGLMQLMPATAESLGVRNIHDPEENIRGGIRYLKKLMTRFPNNVDHAIAAYNAGERAVIKYNGVPPFAETVDYVKKVRKYYDELKTRATESASINAPSYKTAF